MTTQTLPLAPERAKKVAKVLGMVLQTVLGAIRANSAPARSIFADHAYSLVGFGCISAASFVHSVFTGLLVTGILCLVFEWKVSE